VTDLFTPPLAEYAGPPRSLGAGMDAEGRAYEDFEFHMPLLKSEGASDAEMLICGVASCQDKDLQGEEVIQKGINFTPCMESGAINWDHRETPDCILGFPTHMSIVNVDDHPRLKKSGAQGHVLYAEGKLYKGHAMAEWAWSLMKAMEQNNAPRRLAWSVQGRVYERNQHRLTKSEVRHLALTHQPIQVKSFAEVLKSLSTLRKSLDIGSAQPLLLENLDPTMTSVLWGGCDKGHYDRSGRFKKGRTGILEHMSECQGHDLQKSVAFLKAIITSGLFR